MFGYHTPPASGSHTRREEYSSDGATANFTGGSPAQHGVRSTHYTTPYEANPFQANHILNHAQLYPPRRQLRTPDYARLLPDWDSHKVIPEPRLTFCQRLKYTPPRATDKDGKAKPLDMKALNDIHKYFKHTFSGSQQESWAGHLDKLESEVFERNSFVPKQCYFTLRMTLRSAALTSIVSIEQGTEKPNWRLCIPAWYKPDAEDLTKMLHYALPGLFLLASPRADYSILSPKVPKRLSENSLTQVHQCHASPLGNAGRLGPTIGPTGD